MNSSLAAQMQSSAEDAESSGRGGGTPEGRQPTILVVDDENGPRLAVRMLLMEDYRVLMADAVEEAIAILENEEVDLVISDIRMPGQTGVELLRYARLNYPDVEVILLTGYGQLETAKQAVECGAYAYLEKPFDNTEMLDHVSRALEKRRHELERQHLERLALEANRFDLLGRIVSGLIHDLGSPLSVAGSHLELMLLDGPKDNAEDRIRLILSQVTLCSEVVRSTLNFLRHRSHDQTALQLDEIAEQCLELAHPIIRKQAITVHRDFQQDLPSVQGDFILLRQAVLNLINNACQAMEDQENAQELELATRSDENWISLSVRDTGSGVPQHVRNKVFDTFYTTKGKEGTGLGLAAVRNIMWRHGGEVRLANHAQGGALFSLRFPRDLPVDSRAL